MDDRRDIYIPEGEPEKRDWVLQRLPIKGGGILRSAMVSEIFEGSVKWVQVEGTTRA